MSSRCGGLQNLNFVFPRIRTHIAPLTRLTEPSKHLCKLCGSIQTHSFQFSLPHFHSLLTLLSPRPSRICTSHLGTSPPAEGRVAQRVPMKPEAMERVIRRVARMGAFRSLNLLLQAAVEQIHEPLLAEPSSSTDPPRRARAKPVDAGKSRVSMEAWSGGIPG